MKENKQSKVKLKFRDLPRFLAHVKAVMTLESVQDVRMKVREDHVHLYSAIRNGSLFRSYKGIRLEVSDVFVSVPESLSFDWIILKSGEFVKLYSNVETATPEVTFTVSSRGNVVSQMVVKEDDIELNYVGGDPTVVPSIEYDVLESQLSSNIRMRISTTPDMFKRMKSINKIKFKRDDKLKDVVSVDVEDGMATFSDLRWKIDLGPTDSDPVQYFFKKHYITQCTDVNARLTFYERFMTVEDGPYLTLTALEIVDV